jgi:hypothetical protein
MARKPTMIESKWGRSTAAVAVLVVIVFAAAVSVFSPGVSAASQDRSADRAPAHHTRGANTYRMRPRHRQYAKRVHRRGSGHRRESGHRRGSGRRQGSGHHRSGHRGPHRPAGTLLGNDTVGSRHNSVVAGRSRAFRFRAIAPGPVAEVHVFVDRGSTASSLAVGLYSNSGGRPAKLLSTGSIDSPLPGVWNPVRLQGTVELHRGQVYWLAVLGEGGVLRYREVRPRQCSSQTSSQAQLPALPPSWGSGKTERRCPLSAYVTLIGSGAPSPEFIAQPIVAPLPAVPAAAAVASPVGAAPALDSPLAPPRNVVLPTISGVPMTGEVLIASEGEWAGSPTVYSYQWEICEARGAGCVDVEGANEGSYTLGSADVGKTLRVLVMAANAGGAASASSPPTGVIEEPSLSPPPQEVEEEPSTPPPAAPENKSLPTISGTTVLGHVLSAGVGSWSGSPTSYAYKWQRCNADGTECSTVTSAAGTYSLGSGDVGHTLRVVVSAKNAGGTTAATSSASAVVTAPAPAAPTDSSPPTISGSTVEGSVLSAAKGTWTGSPTAYAYQWERCETTGGGCSNVSGATGTSYTLAASDVGHTLRVLVSASNGGGKGSATSAQTATVTAHTGTQVGCFASPGACGFPDPKSANVGPSVACSSLAASGSVTVTTAGATVEGKNISGGVEIDAKNVTLTDDCITADGGGGGGSAVVSIGSGDTGTQITHSDISGANSTTGSVEEALSNNYSNASTSADHDYIYNCGECLHGEWKLTNSYVTASANISGAHYEDIYCSDETEIVEHDVLINPHEQTANLFCDTNLGGGGPADNHITVTNSLLAGSGYSLYPQGNSTSVGSSTMTITGNRFARCLGKPIFDGYGNRCEGLAEGETDSYGYYPNGGFYGHVASVYCPPAAGQVWSGNVWDNNNETVGCE